MRIYSQEECARWSQPVIVLDERRKPTHDLAKAHLLRCEFPASFSQMLWFSHLIEMALQPRQSCLVWVTGWGIFPSNENFHLFYRFRQAYGDSRLLDEAPGHLCLDYERSEVVTLVHMGILFGWDLHLIATSAYARAFVCHDEWVDIGFDDRPTLDKTAKEMRQAGLVVSVSGSEEV